MATWYSTADQSRLAGAWAEAPIENEELCGFILDTARLQVTSYAPAAESLASALGGILLQFGHADRLEEVLALLELEEEPVPFNYVFAQLQQAKNLWAATESDSNGSIGPEGYSFQPRPLDKTIRNMIRPIDGKPDVY